MKHTTICGIAAPRILLRDVQMKRRAHAARAFSIVVRTSSWIDLVPLVAGFLTDAERAFRSDTAQWLAFRAKPLEGGRADLLANLVSRDIAVLLCSTTELGIVGSARRHFA